MKRSGSAPREKRAGELERYNEMRDFGVTAEPPGDVGRSRSGHSFVVQKHAARRLHYDFRLEHEGVLKSWAVPKGPSLSPKDRRLAVQTEDHPVDYRDFEGTIPEGEYGGGPVIVWDRGEWTPVGDPDEGLRKGRLEFVLEGGKLHGRFMLVRLADDGRARGRGGKKNGGAKTSWLLMKRTDEHVREGRQAEIVTAMPESVLTGRTIEDVAAGVPAVPRRSNATKSRAKRTKASKAGATKTRAAEGQKAPRAAPARGAKVPAFSSIAPALALLVDDVPTGEAWVYELKYDGYRAIATLDGGEVRIATRSGKDWTDSFPEVAAALSHVRARNAVFDGEIAHVLEDGRTDFQHLQNALSFGDRQRLVYFVFDLLFYDGVDLRGEPLTFRKNKLRTILAGEKPPLRMGDHVTGNGEAFLHEACRIGLEGIIAKRADAPYRSGRGRDWLKIKCQRRQELVIAGYTLPKGSRKGLGALLLAVCEGGAFRYAGKVGTGFTEASLAKLHRALTSRVVEEPPVVGAPPMRDAVWVRPELVCQVRFTEWTRDGVLRHPAFEGLREDKNPREVVRETSSPTATALRGQTSDRAAKKTTAKKTTAKKTTAKRDEKVTVAGVAISHPDRVLDPASGIRKQDLARYHEAVVDWLLPFAKKRPLMLVRCTDAITGGFPQRRGRSQRASCFVQKHSGRGLLENIGRAEIEGEEVLYVTKPRDVIELAQLSTVEIHGWGSRLPRWDRPDWVVFDLDPDEGLSFARVVEAAREVKDELSRLGLESFVKTTGGKGLHVVVPLTPKHDWTLIRAFAEAIAEGLVRRAPDRYVATMSKAKRAGKIFVDWFRNGKGATAILPYSPRAREGATVALPIAWRDLGSVDPRELTVLTVPALLARRRSDPWRDLLEINQTLSRGVLAKIDR
jgi:bifunctional non-homologous end joining protein LigD